MSAARNDGLRRVLAVSSGGGHWVQLLRLRPAFEGYSVTYLTVDRAYAADLDLARGDRFRIVNDATRWNKLGLLWMAVRVLWVVFRERPDVVISTGAAPGYFALRFGRWLGARTVWLDSIANVDQLSMTGQLVRKHAELWLTQWPELSRPEGPHFVGAVL